MNLPLNQIVCGDAFTVLKGFPEESIDLVVADPPYGLQFMGKDWDKAVPHVEVWRECLRVLKSGGFAFIMCGSRLDCLSQMAVNLRLAGFEIGFSPIFWAYASGFPKAMNISKMVDKKNNRNWIPDIKDYLNEQRKKKGLSFQQINEYLGVAITGGGVASALMGNKQFNELPTVAVYAKLKNLLELDNRFDELIEREEAKREVISQREKLNAYSERGYSAGIGTYQQKIVKETIPATEQAKGLDGCYGGFQPKPAIEIIIVCMKPLSEKTYVEQALRNGKGITWLDDARIPFQTDNDKKKAEIGASFIGKAILPPEKGWNENEVQRTEYDTSKGRFPANLLVSDDALNDGKEHPTGKLESYTMQGKPVFEGGFSMHRDYHKEADSGSFSRYFDLDKWFEKTFEKLSEEVKKTFPFLIVPKASKTERNMGCENLPKVIKSNLPLRDGSGDYVENTMGDGSKSTRNTKTKNFHPTVKPLKLMSYLITLGSRENDLVLDPFVGSGTTCISAKILNRNYIGIDVNPEYCEIAQKRIATIPEKLSTFIQNEEDEIKNQTKLLGVVEK